MRLYFNCPLTEQLLYFYCTVAELMGFAAQSSATIHFSQIQFSTGGG